MKVVKQVVGKSVQVGGQEHSGWLPLGVSQPAPVPKDRALIDVRILQDVQGFILEFEFQDASAANDSWHFTVEEAEKETERKFGIAPSEWISAADVDI